MATLIGVVLLVVLCGFSLHSYEVHIRKRNLVKKVVAELRKMELSGSPDNLSVCTTISDNSGVFLWELVPFNQYPNFSGSRTFPIKHPDIGDPGLAYASCKNFWAGGYGKERKRFCRWCADYLCKKWNIKENP